MSQSKINSHTKRYWTHEVISAVLDVIKSVFLNLNEKLMFWFKATEEKHTAFNPPGNDLFTSLEIVIQMWYVVDA